jgi:hypothetical protein
MGRLAVTAALWVFPQQNRAQVQQTAQDPIMSLMMSQPRVDVSGPVIATAAFDPEFVRPGQKCIYRVTFNALEQMVEWPKEISTPPQLELSSGAHGQIMQPSGGGLQPRTTFNSRAMASVTGEFTVPAYEVQVNGKPVTVPAASLKVVTNPPVSPFTPRLLIDVPKTNLFVGEAVNVRVLFPGSAGVVVQAGPPVQLTGQGFLVDQASARQRFEMRLIEGTNLPSYLYETTLVPIDSGRISFFAQAHTAGNYFAGPVISGSSVPPGGPVLYTLLESEPLELEVRPLPKEGQLPGFTGAIGRFTLEPSRMETNVLRVGDPVKLTAIVRAEGPIGRLVPPPPPLVKDWQVFPSPGASPVQPSFMPGLSIASRLAAIGSLASFAYTMVPLSDSVKETPAIPFSYYDPERAVYVDLTIPPAPVEVSGQVTVAADVREVMRSGGDESSKEPALSPLATVPGWGAASLVPLQQQAWFPLAQFLPAAGFLGLWCWDRRRRFLEKHPDVVWRRRARRAVRRERRAMRRAVSRGDSPAFAAAALSAIRAACAPHFRAEPQSLIGSDVVQVIRSMDWSSAAAEPTVQRLFNVTDASRFGMGSADVSPLLSLRPQVEEVLQTLEARL